VLQLISIDWKDLDCTPMAFAASFLHGILLNDPLFPPRQAIYSRIMKFVMMRRYHHHAFAAVAAAAIGPVSHTPGSNGWCGVFCDSVLC